jgi:peptide/nickel transport system substrate-binding protein
VGRHRSLRRLLVVCAVAAALVAALGAAAGAAGASSPSSGASPGSGKVMYKVGILAEPDNLNPFIGYLWSSFEIWYLTYDTLVGYDYGQLKPIKGEASPGLATDWSVSDDGKTWTFTIREGAKWQDGEPLTARDVAFSYNYIIKNELSAFTSYVQGITRAVAVDDTHVRFECAKPKANMLRIWVPVVPEHIWSKVPGSAAGKTYTNKAPYVGSGPFKCVEWKKNSYVKLVANDAYWRGRPHIDELFFDYYTNADSMVQDLKSGVIDGATGLLDAQYRQLKTVPGIEARTVETNGFDELAFNCYTGPSRGNPVLKDIQFRQALNWAVDRDKIAAIAYGGHARAATTVITEDYYTDPDWHWQPPADQTYGFDVAKAGQLLDAAGYKDGDGDGVREDKQGEPIKLRLWARAESMVSQSVGKLLAGWFKEIGLTIEFQTLEEGSITDSIYDTVDGKLSPDYDMFLWGWYSDLDPDPILSYFTTKQIGSWSDCGWSNAEYDQLYNEQQSMLDDQKRKEIIGRMQQLLYEESPYIVTVYSNDLEAFNTAKWEGYKPSPAEIGNVLFPPYGNAGNENFMLIRPKTATTTQSSGGGAALWAGIAAAVVIVLIVSVVLLRRRRSSAEEE